ncbi:hypothetical protein, partial [Comamonas testosteroni]|uniref:hypothetical protein n=1 Tax=Comamonas testosteroni TaxID=285 RepID=UPI0005B3033C
MKTNMTTLAQPAPTGHDEVAVAALTGLYMRQRRGLWLQQQACLDVQPHSEMVRMKSKATWIFFPRL